MEDGKMVIREGKLEIKLVKETKEEDNYVRQVKNDGE